MSLSYEQANRVNAELLSQALEEDRLHPQTLPSMTAAETLDPREAAPVKLTCCDGTGWTGNPRERCVEHYEPNDPMFSPRTM